MTEHDDRSMRDGQIHNVLQVAKTIREVKNTLEERLGFPLHKASVAAAGRSLKTMEASATIDLQTHPIKTVSDEKHLELTALQKAQEMLGHDNNSDGYNNYYCVGYSLLYYTLDEERIGSLIAQKGENAGAKIIATFLPKVVVESLFSSVLEAGLEVEAMTLEPIAALHVLIPESMRRLNVVLVDIGAGTSDIAITDNGTVVSYGMVPVAGDEITEAISDTYLLDFPEAERVKRKVVHNNEAEMEDILGMTSMLNMDDLTSSLTEPLNHLTQTIAHEINRLNQKAPRAVMLIGGGSLTPNLTNKLAEHLELPNNRIAIRGVEAIKSVETNTQYPTGPAFVTPIGIALTAKERPVRYKNVFVNGEPIRLFVVHNKTVGDALVQAGIEMNRYYGKPGLAAIVSLNGKDVTIPGHFGDPPNITLNGKEATVNSIVDTDDVIEINKGKDGKPAQVSLGELIESDDTFHIYYNEKSYRMGNLFRVNDRLESASYIVNDRDTIEWNHITTVADFLNFYQQTKQSQKAFHVVVNKERVTLRAGETKLLINNEEATSETRLSENDKIEIIPATLPTVHDLFNELNIAYWNTIDITFNEKAVTLKQPAYTVMRDEERLNEKSKIKPNERFQMDKKESHSFVFQDVFRYVELDLTNVSGNFHLFCNDELATFTTPIQSGDKLEIKWND